MHDLSTLIHPAEAKVPCQSDEQQNDSWASVYVFASVQALSQSGQSIIVILSALTGLHLSGEPSLATLPIALQFVGTMVAAVPVSMLMHRVGRRTGFTVGQIVGLIAAIVATFSIMLESFWLFTLTGFLFGIHNAAWQHLRFAAAETVCESKRARAVSRVVLGGIVSAFIGPYIALQSAEILPDALNAGGYIAIAALCMTNAILVQFAKFNSPNQSIGSRGALPITTLFARDGFVLAVVAATVGVGVMVGLMTATPLAMAHAHKEFHTITFVIQWHIVGMYAPSIFTGKIIDRIGIMPVIGIGLVFDLLAIFIHALGDALGFFWIGLFLLGFGWNFLFVGGTTLLTKITNDENRERAQSINELAVFTAAALGSLLSGAVLARFGWANLNLVMCAALAILAMTLLLKWKSTKASLR